MSENKANKQKKSKSDKASSTDGSAAKSQQGRGHTGAAPRPGGPGVIQVGMPVQKAKDFKGTLVRLLKYLRPHKVGMYVVLAFAVISTLFSIYAPQVTREAMNALQDAYVARSVLRNMSELQAMQPEVFADLPKLSDLADANEKADTVEKMIQRLQEIAGASGPDGSSSPLPSPDAEALGEAAANSVSEAEVSQIEATLTPEQLQGAVLSIRLTNGVLDRGYIVRVLVWLGIIYLLSAIFMLIMQWLMADIAQKTVYVLRKDVDSKLGRLPLKYFDTRTHGEIMSRVTNDVDNIAGTLQQSLTQIVTSIISLIGFCIMMFTISGGLTMIVLLTLPLYVFATYIVTKKSQKYFSEQQKSLGELSGHVEEMYTGHRVVKAFGKEKDAVKKFEEIHDKLYESGWKAQFVSGILWPLMGFVGNIGYVIICVIGGLWITLDRLRIGDITAFITYSRSFTHPIIQTANSANIIQTTIACAERIFEVLDESELSGEPEIPSRNEFPVGELVIEGVFFRYKIDEPLIENMNLKVSHGHTVAIVGPTGAGKTTLVNLLMRFYELDNGSIRIDGIDIKDMARGDLRAMFGMVLQDTWLFNGTIRENIAYGRLDATEAEIIEAAQAAHADHFIRTLPNGYDTVLNEEATNISQGQKQLLTLARAILAKPTILILDEATSSVDTRTEVLIQSAMANLMKDRTSFVIAHRLSTIRDAELILVMNNGSIIEQGTHKELLQKNGFYSDLYYSQFTSASA